MTYDFLKQFPRRMKTVGMYTLLMKNSLQKTTWKQYGWETAEEQVNLIFATLLYIMEQSLKDESCTIDDIAGYLDELNMHFFHKPFTYEESRSLAEFIVNVILCDEGRAMYFQGYDFDASGWKSIHVSFVANRIVYADAEVRRTSYYLTDDGYNLLLGTLEIENNMKLTIHEMIFKMHLERATYDKAVDEIKNIFNLLRIQLQKLQEAMNRIRRNALSYSVADYEAILNEDLAAIGDTKEKFQNYREVVQMRVHELEEIGINVHRLDKKDENKLENLRIIESYLSRSIDEHQKILNSHFDLKSLYTKELEDLLQMSLIRRFSLRSDLYDRVLQDAAALENLEVFLRPLFLQQPEKVYNLNKCLELQRPIREKKEEDAEELLEFDEESYRLERERQQREKMKKYENSLRVLLRMAFQKGSIMLSEMDELPEDEQEALLPGVDIFKEIMVELIKSKCLDFPMLRRERANSLQQTEPGFHLAETVLNLIDEHVEWQEKTKLIVLRVEDGKTVTFSCDGKYVRCSNVLFRVE